MTDWKASIKATLVGAASGTAMALLAFSFLNSRQSPAMGDMLFLFVPIVAGFSIALVARGSNTVAAITMLSVVCTLLLLIATGKEGTLCAVLALPIILGGLLLGVGFGVLARKIFASLTAHQNLTLGMLVVIAPMLLVIGEKIETPALQQARMEVIEDSVEVDQSPDWVWNHILSIDELRASKSLLMFIGLPIPERCELLGQGVGAKRTCYFNSGYIEETVTRWNPPYSLGLSIDRTHMPGRHWLGFESAEYRITPDSGKVIVTRSTTIASHLHPSWYWRGFERMGVEAEHRYILQDIVLQAKR